mmetsp:Transcript_5526/g.8746  ORF Transcript_5526/g.8746 Transcript_5526/m.8746 type:complete len:466 (+) Transcript_5526:272-1669(+)
MYTIDHYYTLTSYISDQAGGHLSHLIVCFTQKKHSAGKTLTCSHHHDNFLHAATPPHAHFNKSGSDVLGLAFRHRCAAALLAFVNTSRIRLVGCLVDGALEVLVGEVTAHLLVGDEALQAGADGHAEDLHEHQGHRVGQQEHEDDGRPQPVVVGGGVRERQVGQEGGGHGDQDAPDQQHKVAHQADGGDAQDVARDQEEGRLGGRAEALAEDGRLDVRVLVQELHALLEAPQAALQHAEQRVRELVVGRLGLLLHVGQERAHQLDDGDDERAKGGGARVVPERGHHALHHLAGARVLARGVREVPLADAHGHDQLADGDDELRGPEEAEQQEPQPVLHVRGEAPALHGVPAGGGVGGEGPQAGRVHRVVQPGQQEQQETHHLDQREEQQQSHVHDSMGCLLHDVHRKRDAVPEAEHHAHEHQGQGAEDAPEDLHARDLRGGVAGARRLGLRVAKVEQAATQSCQQ